MLGVICLAACGGMLVRPARSPFACLNHILCCLCCHLSNSAEGGVCCTRQTDVLEAAGLISDATELAKVG